MRAVLLAGLTLLSAAPLPAQEDDRWQVTLDDGKILWELHLVKLAGDTLVVRRGDSTYAFPITRLDEIRMVRKAQRSITPEAGRYGGVLGGADDEVHRLTLYDLSERRQILEQVFKDHPPQRSP